MPHNNMPMCIGKLQMEFSNLGTSTISFWPRHVKSSAPKRPLHTQFHPPPRASRTDSLESRTKKVVRTRPSFHTNRQTHTYRQVHHRVRPSQHGGTSRLASGSRSSQDAPGHTGSDPSPLWERETLLLSSNQSSRCRLSLRVPPVHLQLDQKLCERTGFLSPVSPTVTL